MHIEKAEKIQKAIEKTGFLFEKFISDILENDGWTVINNRYYIDNTTNIPRELDILAYKANSHMEFKHYFVILISCKKTEDNDWVFLTKKSTKRNIDLHPVLLWTNSEIVEATDFKNDLKNFIINGNDERPEIAEIFDIANNVYAFQEVKGEKPQNDKNIYQSIDSLLKAAAFEIKSLAERKKEPVCYTFNLLTVLDGDIYELNNDNGHMDIQLKENVKYVNRFIINNEDSFYRLQFCTKSYFPTLLSNYEQYRQSELRLFSSMIDGYFSDCIYRPDYLMASIKKIDKELKKILIYKIKDINNLSPLSIIYDSSASLIQICIDYIYLDTTEINQDKYIKAHTAKVLDKYLHYKGQFEYSDIPF
jgi:hypothetical protein